MSDWRESAACVGLTDIFFPTRTKGSDDPYAAASAICSDCPVKVECREYARNNRELYGMWGNERPQDRNANHSWSRTGDFYDCLTCTNRFWRSSSRGGRPDYCSPLCKAIANEGKPWNTHKKRRGKN